VPWRRRRGCGGSRSERRGGSGGGGGGDGVVLEPPACGEDRTVARSEDVVGETCLEESCRGGEGARRHAERAQADAVAVDIVDVDGVESKNEEPIVVERE